MTTSTESWFAAAANLTGSELAALVRRVFGVGPGDRALAVLVDLPDRAGTDQPAWAARRALAAGWVEALRGQLPELGLARVELLLYRQVGQNNADLPEQIWLHPGGPLPTGADQLDPAAATACWTELGQFQLILAPTQFSATAPLKLAAPRLGLRAATMPGFSPAMIPALRLDYTEIARRVRWLKELLDEASGATIRFVAKRNEPHDFEGEICLKLDLRFRTAHESSGLIRQIGTAGNLPSGEAYIVPYEGERECEPSRSEGLLPVQLGDELVVYRIADNRAQAVLSQGAHSAAEADRLRREPAYGNLAELGLGVLADFGVQPCGELLLDEKLGLHVAFGRSDHFGGQVGVAQFTTPSAAIHLDRVYLPQTQPLLEVVAATLHFVDRPDLPLIEHDRWVAGWGT